MGLLTWYGGPYVAITLSEFGHNTNNFVYLFVLYGFIVLSADRPRRPIQLPHWDANFVTTPKNVLLHLNSAIVCPIMHFLLSLLHFQYTMPA